MNKAENIPFQNTQHLLLFLHGFFLQAFLSEGLSHRLEEVRYRKINQATIILQKHVSFVSGFLWYLLAGL